MILSLVLAVLATWRVTHLLASEDGPGDVIFRLRRWLGESVLGALMDCFNCISLWIAIPFALFVSRQPLEWPVVWLAISGGACLLERMVREPVPAQPVPRSVQGDLDHVLWTETRTADNPSFVASESDSGSEEKPAH